MIPDAFVSADPPEPGAWRATYAKVRERVAFHFALSALALALRFEPSATGGQRIAEARLVLGGVAPKPWRCRSTEALLVGREANDETARLAAEDALQGAKPLAHNAYKIPMTKGLLTRTLRRLAGR